MPGGRFPVGPLVGVFALVEDVLLGVCFETLTCALLDGRLSVEGVLDRENGGLVEDDDGLFFRMDTGSFEVPAMV
jgi:hypothetical protein